MAARSRCTCGLLRTAVRGLPFRYAAGDRAASSASQAVGESGRGREEHEPCDPESENVFRGEALRARRRSDARRERKGGAVPGAAGPAERENHRAEHGERRSDRHRWPVPPHALDATPAGCHAGHQPVSVPGLRRTDVVRVDPLREGRPHNVSPDPVGWDAAGVDRLKEAVGEALGGEVVAAERVTGGSLNDAWRMTLRGRRAPKQVFVKTAADAQEGRYRAEAAGLFWIAGAPGAPAVPEVLERLDEIDGDLRFLVLEWIEEDPAVPLDEEALGRGLAALHVASAPAYGSGGTFHLGPLMLRDPLTETWAESYGEYRLRPLALRACETGRLGAPDGAAVERVCERLEELAGPVEPPSRLHGDLWAGNIMTGAGGQPWLVDPACYGGHREVDLAMLRPSAGRASAASTPTGRRRRSPTGGRNVSGSGSSSRCWSTQCCSVGATAVARARWPPGTPEDAARHRASRCARSATTT